MDRAVQDDRQPFFNVLAGDPVKSFAPWALNFNETCGLSEASPIWTLALFQGVACQGVICFLEESGYCRPASEALSRKWISKRDD